MSNSAEIRFITRKWGPAIGGMETYSMELAAALGKRQPVETMALAGRKDGSPPGPVRLLWWGLATAFRLAAARPVPSVLLGDMAIWPLGWLARLRGSRRIVLAAHGTDVSYARRHGLRGALYRAYQRCGARLLKGARVIAVSQATRRAAEECGWRNLSVVPLATSMRSPAAPAGHDGSILFVGRLIELKGCGWFIRNVLPELPEGTRLRVAGPRTEPAESAALDAEGVEYLGSLRGEELIAAYRQALCVVLPNIEMATGQFEGFGIVAVEAAAAGGVVLASHSGGLSEAVRDGETGFLVAPGDSKAWVEAIAKVRDWSAAERQRFVGQAHATASAYFSWDRVAGETLAICAATEDDL